MRSTIHVLILVSVAALGLSLNSKPFVFSSQPVVVAELFTSEGCSSCPAADELLKEMVELTAKEEKTVIGLAFHVTYWNHLGWNDPYSQELFTTRQKKYTEKLTSQQYTPQMVVNGEYEFVGSNPVAFRSAIEKAWSKPAVYQIDATANLENNALTIGYSLDKDPKSEWLNVALVEKALERQVTRGENKNRTLKHYNVVRKFETIVVKKSGEITLSLPENFNIENVAVILYVQHPRTLKISGAAKIDLT